VTVVLVGLMGAGKSTVGAVVASDTGRFLVDVDVAIEERTGMTVRRLWESGGEGAYRQMESKVVLHALAGRPNAVLAAPGGVVLDPAVRAALADVFVLWLRSEPGTLSARVGREDHRPLLGNQSHGVLATMALERSGLYQELADLVIDTDDQDPKAVAAHIVLALRERASGD
jgi:shikimate kinase